MQLVSSLQDVQQAVRSSDRIRVAGGGSKPSLSSGATLSVANLRGMLQYEPTEYTFTALAGTPLADIDAALKRNGQFMPFDPPLLAAGATLGGTVAAGLSGAGRYRYGGVRDFLLGVRLVNGQGEIVFGGGKVVKNAAGFDIPKLMVGAWGRLGVMVELTMKVFPRPQAFGTLRVPMQDTSAATEMLLRLAGSPLEPTCLDLEPPSTIWMRIAGLANALPARLARARSFVELESYSLLEDEDEQHWTECREFSWLPHGHALIKIPICSTAVPNIEEAIQANGWDLPRRYSMGGNILWLGWPDTEPNQVFREWIASMKLPAMALTGSWDAPMMALNTGGVFADRLRSVFDPDSKFY